MGGHRARHGAHDATSAAEGQGRSGEFLSSFRACEEVGKRADRIAFEGIGRYVNSVNGSASSSQFFDSGAEDHDVVPDGVMMPARAIAIKTANAAIQPRKMSRPGSILRGIIFSFISHQQDRQCM